jgi:hypothetical protein
MGGSDLLERLDKPGHPLLVARPEAWVHRAHPADGSRGRSPAEQALPER